MSTGVTVNDDCLEVFQNLKSLEKSRRKIKYIIYKISDDQKEIVVDTTADEEENKIPPLSSKEEKVEFYKQTRTDFENFTKTLDESKPRYIVYDFVFVKPSESGHKSKVCLINWCPDNAKVKEKMLYAASFDALSRRLEGVSKVQANDYGDITYDQVLKKVEPLASKEWEEHFRNDK